MNKFQRVARNDPMQIFRSKNWNGSKKTFQGVLSYKARYKKMNL